MSYVGEVTNLLQLRCDNIKILGPMDYVTIAEWEKQEIPLAVVIETINEICDRPNDDHPRIDSAIFFQEKIKSNFRRWLQTEGERS